MVAGCDGYLAPRERGVVFSSLFPLTGKKNARAKYECYCFTINTNLCERERVLLIILAQWWIVVGDTVANNFPDACGNLHLDIFVTLFEKKIENFTFH